MTPAMLERVHAGAPGKDAVFDEIDRVLRPGGRLQVADVIIHTDVSVDARARIDLWTG